MVRIARIIGLLCLAAALGACSAIKLGYNNIDNLAYWWLDSYIDFSDTQAVGIREDLRRIQGWHRAEELPRMSALLRRLEEIVPGNVTPEQACTFVAPVRERLDALLNRAEPVVVTLALGLEPAQITHLEKKYERNNADYRKEWVSLSPAELKEKRMQSFIDRSEMFYGTLEEPQLAALRDEMDRSSFDPKWVLSERQRRQQDLLRTLRQVAGQPIALTQARALMRGYLDRTLEPPEPAQRALQQKWINEACRNVAALHNATSPSQRESAARRLRAYQRDLRELSAKQ